MINRLLFSLWYFGRPPWDSGISPPELIDYLSNHAPGRAIDLGCGTGTNLVTMAKAGWKVTGVDFAGRALKKAQEKLNNSKLEADLIPADVTKFKSRFKFDLALDIGCFHGVRDRKAYLESLLLLLKPGGHWLLYGFFKENEQASGPGLTGGDLNLMSNRLELLWRRDGTDKRGRPSAWFQFQKKITTA
jgi:SAM-dependent methyltransferase